MTKTTKRILSLYMLFTVCFMAIFVRIIYINFTFYSSASQKQSTRTVVVGTTRGKIYDRNKELLVDETNRLVAAVTPSSQVKQYIGEYFSDESIASKIENGYPFVTTVKKEIDNELIKTFSVPIRYNENSLATHLVGYTDSSGRGVTGVEKSFEKLLSDCSGKLSVSFEVNALGQVLAGMDKTVISENYNSQAGVLLTIDKRIQSITEQALEQSSIKSGCAVVMHIDSGDIAALASVPDFDRNNIEKSLDDDTSPLMNKALSSYSAGSVFKSIVAAYAIESGIDEDFTVECEGTTKIGENEFSCYGCTAHGEVNMAQALQKSCNIYFINLIKKLDIEKFISFCTRLGFGQSIALCDDIVSQQGILPDTVSLSSPAGLANFSFGQGDLLVTPLQMLKAYHALAMGTVVEPRLIYGFCDSEGLVGANELVRGKRVLSDETVEKMRQMLFDVTDKGIATAAKSELMQLAGKTGTAQSGVFDSNGQEILRTWFVGFYPANNPHYIVVVMNENGVGGNTDCGPVFKNICQWIACDSLRNN